MISSLVTGGLCWLTLTLSPIHAAAGPCPAIPGNWALDKEGQAVELLRSQITESDLRGAGFSGAGLAYRVGAPIPVLHVAAYKSCVDFVRYHLSIHGLEGVSIRNLAEMNVLHIAVAQGHEALVALLLDQGADPAATIPKVLVMGADGNVAVLTDVDARRLAEVRGHSAIVRLIDQRTPWWKFWLR